MLRVDRLSAAYGEATAVRDVSLRVEAGEIVTLVGRNGAGKTTLLRTIMGLHPVRAGRVVLGGTDITDLAAHRRARLGLGWVPDDRGAYATLTVDEALTLSPVHAAGGWTRERVYDTFPALGRRRATLSNRLSGGEQQMLALARVLWTGARLLLCDEPTEGLSPLFVAQVGDLLREVKAHGVTVLLVEQNVHFAATVADRHYVLAEGRVVEELDAADLTAKETELLTYLGM